MFYAVTRRRNTRKTSSNNSDARSAEFLSGFWRIRSQDLCKYNLVQLEQPHNEVVNGISHPFDWACHLCLELRGERLVTIHEDGKSR